MFPNVIFAAIDGLRAAALLECRCPNIMALATQGAFTLNATSVVPSITLPCFTSIFYSQPPERHGTLNNVWVPNTRPAPGLIEAAHSAGKRCAFFYNWEPLRDLNAPLNLSFSLFIDNLNTGPGSDRVIMEHALHFMQLEDWDFAFIYLGSLDTAGHAHGFMSLQYLRQLELLDEIIGSLCEALPGETSLLLTSDHGGHARTHGTMSPEDMTIPWFLTGPEIQPGREIPAPVSLLDTAPTLARLLGIAPHPTWEGQCIEEAFIERGGPARLE